MLWCSVLHLVVWPDVSLWAIFLVMGPMCHHLALCLVLMPYALSLGCTCHTWAICIVLQQCVLSLGRTCHPLVVRLLLGSYTSSLRFRCHCLLLGCMCHCLHSIGNHSSWHACPTWRRSSFVVGLGFLYRRGLPGCCGYIGSSTCKTFPSFVSAHPN